MEGLEVTGNNGGDDKDAEVSRGNAPRGGRVAIVLSGAGARGAYEAGALSVLLPHLIGDDRPRVVLGTSAGALNAAMLASLLHQPPALAAKELLAAWGRIRPEMVFATPRKSALRLVGLRLRRPVGEAPGVLDTRPLRATLRVLLPNQFFGSAVPGTLDAVGVVASACATGDAVVFLQTSLQVPKPQKGIAYMPTQLGYDHLMASSAFPLAFPAQWVEGPAQGWYIDGGVHLNTPLKPAIALGADRLLVIGATPLLLGQKPDRSSPPNVMDGSGQILHSLLVDSLRKDLDELRRTNLRLGVAPATRSATHGATTGRRVIEFAALSPANDELSDVAAGEWPPGLLKFLCSFGGYGALGPVTAQRQLPGQFLSYLCFTKGFISAAIEAGKADARQLIKPGVGIDWKVS
jgi:NTE family protein